MSGLCDFGATSQQPWDKTWRLCWSEALKWHPECWVWSAQKAVTPSTNLGSLYGFTSLLKWIKVKASLWERSCWVLGTSVQNFLGSCNFLHQSKKSFLEEATWRAWQQHKYFLSELMHGLDLHSAEQVRNQMWSTELFSSRVGCSELSARPSAALKQAQYADCVVRNEAQTAWPL